MTGTHVVAVLDERGRWADVLGPFADRSAAAAFRRQLVRRARTRRGYFGLHGIRAVVAPLLSAQAYEDARGEGCA